MPRKLIRSSAVYINHKSTFSVGLAPNEEKQREVIEHLPDGRSRVLMTGIPEETADHVVRALNTMYLYLYL